MSADSAIVLENVSVRFGKQAILRNLSLSLAQGKTNVLIGESGCGKSVTLKLVVGLIAPTQGRVLVDGKDLAKMRESERISMRLRVGFLFQGAALFDSMNVQDNVSFGLRAQGKSTEKEILQKVTERILEVGLPENVLPKMPSDLSGGMRKRVGLARALALDPDIMLYDEPTTGLDPIMSDVINELILQTRRKRPLTSLVVTHDMKTVMKVADRIIMIYPLARLKEDEPQVIFDGTVEDLHRHTDPRVKNFVEGVSS